MTMVRPPARRYLLRREKQSPQSKDRVSASDTTLNHNGADQDGGHMTEKKAVQTTDLIAPFRARLPYPTIPTNIQGVLATAPLPTDFNPRTASAPALLTHGLLWRRPAEHEGTVASRAWNRAFAKPWSPEKHVVPALKTHHGRRHRRPRSGMLQGSQTNWAGAVLDGTWTTVSSYWVVPTVSKPKETAGVGGGWDSSTWIGIDGDFSSDDVLQAGTSQNVDSHGNASYYAWFEWVCAFSKVTLSDSTPSNFALASDAPTGSPHDATGGDLFVAFRGESNHLDFLVSTNSGATFGDKLTSSETTGTGPALALFGGATLFVAWTGTSNDRLNLARVAFSGTTLSLANKVTLTATSFTSPALASLGQVLFLAWRDANGFINVAASSDGQSFPYTFTSTVKTPSAPSLAVHEDRLFIAWEDEGYGIDVGTVTVVNDPAAGISNLVTGIANVAQVNTEATPVGPSIASNGRVLFVSWKGSGNDHLNVIQSTDGGRTFHGKYISPETSPSAPFLTMHDGEIFIGWRGENDHLNVSVVGYRDATIQGFTPAPYLYETEITNFPVHPGDEIVCSVFYVDNATAGYVALGNVTTGDYFSITIYPPPAADVSGSSIEWIMETPTLDAELTVLPKFTPVVFTDAFGCGPNFTIGNPMNGTTDNIINAAQLPVTSVTLASDKVTIDFTG